jgi:hypothetical protein
VADLARPQDASRAPSQPPNNDTGSVSALLQTPQEMRVRAEGWADKAERQLEETRLDDKRDLVSMWQYRQLLDHIAELARDVVTLSKELESVAGLSADVTRLEGMEAELRSALVTADWLITCYRDMARGVPVRGLAEASAAYDSACPAIPIEEGEDATMSTAEYRAATQKWVDGTCHYRNLAIKLGAKPENMLSKYDRDLAARGFDASDGGWDDDTPELWEELEAAEVRVKELEQQVAHSAENAEIRDDEQAILLALTWVPDSPRHRPVRDAAHKALARLADLASALSTPSGVPGRDSTAGTVSGQERPAPAEGPA